MCFGCRRAQFPPCCACQGELANSGDQPCQICPEVGHGIIRALRLRAWSTVIEFADDWDRRPASMQERAEALKMVLLK